MRKRIYEVEGEWLTVLEICERADISPSTFYYRMAKGMTAKEILRHGKRRACAYCYTLGGEAMSITEIEHRLYLSNGALYQRARRHGTTVQREIDAQWRQMQEAGAR